MTFNPIGDPTRLRGNNAEVSKAVCAIGRTHGSSNILEKVDDLDCADPTIFNAAINPSVTSWFKTSAGYLLDRVPGYHALLDRYQIAWIRKESDQPGRLMYEVDVQVVVAPFRVGVSSCRSI